MGLGMESSSQLFWGMVFGAIGFGFLSYGWKQKAMVPLFSGVGLMIVPYFLDNVYALIGAGVLLMAAPYFIRL